MLMTALTRPVRFWVHQSVFSWPLVGRVVQWLEMIPVVPGRARESLRLGLERLRAGEVLAIFPEGKLTEDGTMDRFQRGVVLMQRKAEALILPFAIHGGFEAWPHGAHWPRFQPVKLVFGQPIPPHSACDEGTLLLLERQVSALRQGG
jgi:1-acyl-sn-glycerol-3-phosphate acyltransferase